MDTVPKKKKKEGAGELPVIAIYFFKRVFKRRYEEKYDIYLQVRYIR